MNDNAARALAGSMADVVSGADPAADAYLGGQAEGPAATLTALAAARRRDHPASRPDRAQGDGPGGGGQPGGGLGDDGAGSGVDVPGRPGPRGRDAATTCGRPGPDQAAQLAELLGTSRLTDGQRHGVAFVAGIRLNA